MPFIHSVYPSVWGWNPELIRSRVPTSLNSSCQKLEVNRGSRSITMFKGMPQFLTTFLKKSSAASSAIQEVSHAMNTAYLLNLSTITIMLESPSTSSNCVMKSILTLAQGRTGMRRGCNKPAGCNFWALSCWQVRQVLTCLSTSSRILGQ